MPQAHLLDVGNCDPDHGSIRRMLDHHFDVVIDRVMFVEDAIEAMRKKTYHLVLVNRLIFERRMQALLDAGTATHSLLYVDIDQLHVINDPWGFETGDRAICAVAEQLRVIFSVHEALVSRLSGDRFTAFIPNCTLTAARVIADKAREAVRLCPSQALTITQD